MSSPPMAGPRNPGAIYVEGNGAFVAGFTDANGHVSRAVGKLSGSSGKGAWSSSSDYCGGRWTASRSGR